MTEKKINQLSRMVDKIALHTSISVEDRVGLLELPYTSRFFEAGSYLLRDGDTPNHSGLLVSGLAYRHKIGVDGLRQIVAIHIPGEVYDLQQLHVATADSNVQTLTRCEVVTISHGALRRLAEERPSVAHAFFVTTIVELSMAREWMLNIGRRDARTRISHLLCEFAFRLDKHGLPPGQAYELPMTQEQLADALGLTAVHINRTLKILVNDGLIAHSKRGVTIPDWEALVTAAGFNSRYLHMSPPDAATGAAHLA
ncbi:Crp/Fnr family transcriptional regulator [Sphingomonas albertensis]|uniref:Crp/Fnr family transcriptional regulator n=1 Tax=Sphingomonas albertensis TaxID=2762591 RepID=A0ABR7ALB7_9SPHN|nr:Crp/Fnr family transcriptional regulator [Sphingomonas albertensis]MBC3941254.1 Crp/Fnr family transcriptional regulator [Sphingomonas albertensis]